MSHFKEYCPFGRVVRQCRCPGGTKTVVPCPPNHNCATPEKLVYAAWSRCPCGAGLAYIPAGTDGYWDCSKILLGTADIRAQHTARLPFVFYEIKSEQQPSANGATTRE